MTSRIRPTLCGLGGAVWALLIWNSLPDKVDRRERSQDPPSPARRRAGAARPGADRGLARRRLGGAPGAGRRGGPGLPLPRLRPGAAPGHRARGDLADARGRERPAARAHRVLAAADAAPSRPLVEL